MGMPRECRDHVPLSTLQAEPDRSLSFRTELARTPGALSGRWAPAQYSLEGLHERLPLVTSIALEAWPPTRPGRRRGP